MGHTCFTVRVGVPGFFMEDEGTFRRKHLEKLWDFANVQIEIVEREEGDT